MRRAVLILTVGGVLLAGAAGCDTGAGTDTGAGQAAVDPSVAAALADTRTVCEALGQVYGKSIGPFATALNTMVASRKGADAKTSQTHAQQLLNTFGASVLGATQASSNPQVRADGLKAASTLQAKSADSAFFSKIQTSADTNAVLDSDLKEWLAPVAQHCT